MEEEIFGPILPILTYESLEQAVEKVNEEPTPLALYMFSEDKKHIRYVTERASFGGGCVNDTIIHLATSAMGFGGCGESGMGAYHGRRGFEAFSHRKSIVDKKTFLDLPMRYQPYQGWKDKLVKIFVR
jgi:aldehyde dehydrogenase (NAD+)